MEQISIFDGTQPLKITKPIRLIELFAGIGAQAKALERIGVPFEHYHICEFDKYAVTSYNAIHGTHFETSDITKISADDLGIVDTDKYTYIMTYSFPCTDLSLAGKRLGMSRGAQTRSGLLWEVERLLRELTELPQILVMENVPQVIGQKNIADFAEWIAFLGQLGYTSKWAVLNAKDFNVPQNRERCFMMSWLGDYFYDFPKPTGCDRRLKDVLETDVDEKYYLTDKQVDMFVTHTEKMVAKGNNFKFEPTYGECIAKSVTTRCGSRTDDNFIKIIEPITTQGHTISGAIRASIHKNGSRNILKNLTDGVSTAVTTCYHPNIIEPKICGMRGRNPDNPSDRSKGCPTEQRIEVGGYVSNALTTVQKDNLVYQSDVRIRKLTPLECFRLMDFDDEDYNKIKEAGISNSQAYKQAGNSIVVAVLEAIFRNII